MWGTPAGTAFVDGAFSISSPSFLFVFRRDENSHLLLFSLPFSLPSPVIALKKAAPAAASNRSTAAMDKWDKEVRESAAKKRAAAGGGVVVLSKQDQALVTAQLALEADVRAKIVKVKAQMERGLALIKSLIAAEVTLFKDQLTDTLQLILDGPLEKGSFLVGEEAFNTFLVSCTFFFSNVNCRKSEGEKGGKLISTRLVFVFERQLLGDCCSPRLGLLRPFVGVAILRNYGVQAVPKDMQEESLSGKSPPFSSLFQNSS